MNVKSGWACVAILLGTAVMRGDDWPQFRGPKRDAASHETGLLRDWPAGGPRLLWTYDGAGVGYSGPAIVGDRLYMSGGRGDSDCVFALDLKSAADGAVKELWSAKIGPLFTWKGNNWNNGPNATPTVDGELVYALGGCGDLVCVEAGTGKERWRINLPHDLGGEVNPIGGGAQDPTPLGWGYAWAPLVDGGQLICVPGGKQGLLAAFDKKTGKVLWRSKEVTDQASYSSPVIVEIGGARQIIQVTNYGIVGVAAKDGRLLWAYRRDPPYDDVVIATPVVHDGYIFSSVGFQQGCDLIRVTAKGTEFSVETVFSNKSVQNRDGGLVRADGFLYGYSENRGWFCQDFKTGEVAWAERRKFDRGSVMVADERLYCLSEKGVLAIVEATPKGWAEHGRLKLPKESARRRPSGMVWTQPVVANGRLYLRDQEFVFCYDLKP